MTGAYTRTDGKAAIAQTLEKVYAYFPRLKTRRASQAAYTSGGEQQMCAIGRALMANPSMVLLDEPSMGLAPQIVEEVFGIVKDLNEKERVTFLLAEQNTNMALRYADYGYILENGRIVMDGEAKSLRENEDVKEFYLGVGGADRKSFRDVKSYKRTQAVAGMTDFYDALEVRDPAERERDLLAALPRQIVQAQTAAAGLREDPRRRRSRPTSRAARRWRSCRSRASPSCWRCRRRAARATRSAASRRSRFGPRDAARVREPRHHLRARRRGARLLAHRARAVRRGLSRRRAGAQLLQLPHDAGRLDHGERRACARLHRVRRRHRPDRAAGRGHRRPAARRLRRHAELPQDPDREGGREEHRAALADQGAGVGRSLSAEPARLDRRARRGRHAVLRHRRPGPDRLRDQRRAKAWCSTRA